MATLSSGPTFEQVVAARTSRRGLLKAALVTGGATAATPLLASAADAAPGDDLTFVPIGQDSSDTFDVPSGYAHDLLISWGDPVLVNAPPFDLGAQTPAKQAMQFGFNCDYTAFFSLPEDSGVANHGVLWVNHEYTDGSMMFPAYDPAAPTAEQVDIELHAHGASVVEVTWAAVWTYDPASARNRRISAFTPIAITGPASGEDRLKTIDEPTGTQVLGMLNNCGGGVTPWGTVLTAEENFNQYFANADACPDPAAKANHLAFGIPGGASDRKWEVFHPRFDTADPGYVNEPFRFGWIVEVDPYDPQSTPKKRTALGRFKHEAAAGTAAPDGRWVIYMGDDERFQYVYKFVPDTAYDPANPDADLLDAGILYAARFDDDGSGVWLPLVYGTGPLVDANGFTSDADVLIRAREAAEAVGATPMDRPEDIEVHPINGKVYIACTNNTQRGAAGRPGPDAANPRSNNRSGHIPEITEDGGDATATTFTWEVFMLCGEPSDPSTYFAGFNKSQVSRIGAPDNLAFDRMGNLWIATDGMPSALGAGSVPGPNDCVLGVPTVGRNRGYLKAFSQGPVGAEMASLYLTPDDAAMFISVQHPGEGGTIASSTSTWPDAATDGVARPTVVVVRRNDRAPLGYVNGPTPVIAEFPGAGLAVAAAAGVIGAAIALRNRRPGVAST